MSGFHHQFLPGLSPQGTEITSQFGIAPIHNQFTNDMHNTLNTRLENQIPMALTNQMNSQLSGQMLMPINQRYMVNNSMNLQHTNFLHVQHQPNVNATPLPLAAGNQSKEFNTASLCRIGQETIQDIISRTQEVFQTLKNIEPPNGTSPGTGTSSDRKAKVQELLRTIRVLFKRLRLIYEKCNESCQLQGMEYTYIESLIPFHDQIDPKYDEKKNTELCKSSCEQRKEIIEQVIIKNHHLKEVIDHLRRIIWEINTMLTMRRS